MEDDDGEGKVLKQAITGEVERCTDADLLDLIYKLLVCGT